MHALVLKALKHPLVYEEVELRTPSEEEVIAQVKAAALNRRDVWIKYGQYPGIVVPTILGSDGLVEVDGKTYLVNPNINWGDNPRFAAKDYQILGLEQRGTFATHIVINRDRLHPKPSHLSSAQAAALPLGGLTAYRALFNTEKGALTKGKKVLITGIGGGVALFALQFSVATGAEVYVTSSSENKIARAQEMGALGGVNYKDPNWSRDLKSQAGGFDVIIDSAGGTGFSSLVKLCNQGARIAFFGATAGHWQKVDAPRLFLKQVTLAGSTMGSDQEFVEMVDFVSRHKIVPTISGVFALSDGNAAMLTMEAGSQFGKLVLES